MSDPRKVSIADVCEAVVQMWVLLRVVCVTGMVWARMMQMRIRKMKMWTQGLSMYDVRALVPMRRHLQD